LMSRTRGLAEQGLEVRAATAADYEAVTELLRTASLPTAGVPPELTDFLVAEGRGRLVGAVGLEKYGDAALLRSAVVNPSGRGHGIGYALVRRLLDGARHGGIREVYLLTTTAEHYFPRFGFVVIARENVPAAVQASVEFREACPASAVVMRMVLDET
jgi:amino-acid N-acetyltransferase